MNWYVEAIESGRGKGPLALYPTPGLNTFTTFTAPGTQAMRGLYVTSVDGRVFAVNGNKLSEIASNGTATDRLVLADDALPATMIDAQNQLLIVSGKSAQVYDLGLNAFDAIAGMLPNPAMCAFCDGFFIVFFDGTNQFQISSTYDATAWDSADVAKISTFNGNIVSMLVDHREIWFWGANRAQVYYNSGNPDFPFDPITGGIIEQGCAARFSPVRLDNSVFWIGADERGAGIAWRAQGYTPSRVSNHAIEYAWQSYPTIADAIGYPIQDQGHAFVVWTFPSANATWVYDASTGMWHERGFWNTSTARYSMHKSAYHAYAFGKHLVGDPTAQKVYDMNINYTTDYGNAIRRLRRAPHISQEQEWTYYHDLQIDLEVGLGLAVGQGSDPQVVLRWSNDGGKTWSNENYESAGKQGQTTARVHYHRMGRGRDRVFEMTVTDPIPWRVIDAYLFAEGGHPAEEMRKVS